MKTRIFAALCALCLMAACKPAPLPDNGDTPDAGKEEKGTPVKLNSITNLTPDFISVEQPREELLSGGTAEIVLKPAAILSSGFSPVHVEHIFVHVGDKIYKPLFPDGTSTASSLRVKIDVPSEDFDVVACYSVQQQIIDNGYTMRLENAPAGVQLFGVSPDEKYKYFDCYLLTPDAYTVNKVEFKMGDGSWQDISAVSGCGFARSESFDRVYNVTVRPNLQNVTGDVALRVSGTQHARYKIAYVNADAAHIDMNQSDLPSESIDGETVVATLYINDDYYLKGVSSSVASLRPDIVAGCYVRFTMPASDLTLTLDFQNKIPLSVTKGAHISEAKFYDADDIYYGVPTDKVTPGGTVYLFATADTGYKPGEVVVGTQKFQFKHYAYQMYYSAVTTSADAKSVEATVNAVRAYNVAASADIALDAGSLFAQGERVTFTVAVPAGKKVESVSVKAADGSGVSVDFNSPYGSFLMPAQDVSVSATFTDVDSGDTVSVSAEWDDDSFSVRSTTNYDWNFATGFTVAKGTTFYLSVMEYYGYKFYVGVKIGESVNIYPATEDDMSGEYEFGKALVADGDVRIKVGYSENDVRF